MYKVKFTPYREMLGKIMHRQTPNHKNISSDGKYQFYIDEEIDDPDFWVVQGKGIRKTTTCKVAKDNTILLTTEPESILIYPKKYINQFAHVCSCQENMKHRDLILGPAMLPWFIGYKDCDDGTCSYSLDYDSLKESETPKKTKLISVITSNKAFTKGHLKRIEFVEKLKKHYGDAIDVYGRGYRDFEDKWDVLSKYKYSIVIENSSQKYYWTEKISDCFLAETYPIYYGCTNLNDYFPENSYQAIDINDYEGAVKIIDKCIAEKRYEESVDILKECKKLALEKYNIFNYVASICDKLDASLPKEEVTIEPCKSMQDIRNFYNYSILRNIFKLEQLIKQLIYGKSILNK